MEQIIEELEKIKTDIKSFVDTYYPSSGEGDFIYTNITKSIDKRIEELKK